MEYLHPITQLVIVEDSSLANVIKKIPYVQMGDENTIDSPDYYFGDNMDEVSEVKKGIITTETNPVINGFRIEAEYYINNKKHTFLRRIGSTPMFPDISFVIQGVDTETSFTSCAIVFIYGYLVVSTWNTYGTLNEIKRHIQQHSIYNNQNIFYQVHSVLLGLARVTTLKVIKMRSDEVILNLLPFIMKMYESPSKIITTNIFIRRNGHFPYHCSDHIMGGSTKNILEMFKNAEVLIHNREDTKLPSIFKTHCWVPEQILTIGFLLSVYPLYYVFECDPASLMNLHFESIDIHSLAPLQIVYTQWDTDENGVFKSKKVTINPDNLHEHQNRIIDLYSYKSLFVA